MQALFALALFTSASLVFALQPMVGKMLLPRFGGSPAVWNTCLMFFQGLLLVGYCYSHCISRLFRPRVAAAVHLGVMLLPWLTLPIVFPPSLVPSGDENPVWWLLAVLASVAALPFFVVSASAPLLQHWFAMSGHARARDPYFLYAASNAGSLLALAAYPLWIEPQFRLATQNRLWMVGYGMLFVLIAACAAVVAFGSRRSVDANGDAVDTRNAEGTSRVSFAQRLRWLGLSFVPSSLMLACTTFITTDVAAVPLLWILPLGLYLLTFIIAFARWPVVPHRWVLLTTPYVLLVMAPLVFARLSILPTLEIPLHLAAFFVVALACHGELVAERPSAEHLTEFYLWMSLGGALGGVFNCAAPALFQSVLEYPLTLLAACFLLRRGDAQEPTGLTWRDFAYPAALGLLTAVLVRVTQSLSLKEAVLGNVLSFGIPALGCFAFRNSPVRMGLGYAVLLLGCSYHAAVTAGELVATRRSFFGVNRVLIEPEGRFRVLVNGRTNHGLQRIDPEASRVPLAYYHPTGPVGDVFRAGEGRGWQEIALVGLGTGSIAYYGQSGQRLTYYEIDPSVIELAQDTRCFTFLSQCQAKYEIIPGDARQSLAREPDGKFDVLILDAFSSDAIPTHLLTIEAIRLYRRVVKPHGLIVFHTSNKHVELEGLLGLAAAGEGLSCLTRSDLRVPDELTREGKYPSRYVAMARTPEDFSALAAMPGWAPPPVPERQRPWTDEYNNLPALLLK